MTMIMYIAPDRFQPSEEDIGTNDKLSEVIVPFENLQITGELGEGVYGTMELNMKIVDLETLICFHVHLVVCSREYCTQKRSKVDRVEHSK